LFHVQHELVKAVSGPMATKERAAHKAVTEAQGVCFFCNDVELEKNQRIKVHRT